MFAKGLTKNVSRALTFFIGIISSVIAGLLIAYFTNIIFKPDVLYTISSFKINLPEKYEEELALIRAKSFASNFEKIVGQISEKSINGKPTLDNESILMKAQGFGVRGPNRAKEKDTVTALGHDFDKMLKNLKNPEILKSLLNQSVSIPTAFSTVDIVNTGNKEATDLDISINPNGVVIEATIESTEPSINSWENIMDTQIGLPIGIHFPAIKRLPPGGKITVRLYWNIVGNSKQEDLLPYIVVKGSYSGGKLQFAESQPPTRTNWLLVDAALLLIALLSFAVGYWLHRTKSSA